MIVRGSGSDTTSPIKQMKISATISPKTKTENLKYWQSDI